MDNRLAAKYIDLVEKMRAHEELIEGLKEQAKALEKRLVENFQRGGIQRATVDGHTLWLDRKVWASACSEAGGTSALAAGLREEGLDELVSEAVNGQRLSAWVREFDAGKDASAEEIASRLPERLRPLITISEVYKLGVRKG